MLALEMVATAMAVFLISLVLFEKISAISHLLMTFLFSVIIYPVICHWMRASMFLHDHQGWLERIGFFDFSGASVIFSVIG